jgi:hypothetical protein
LIRRHGNSDGSGYGEPSGIASFVRMLRNVDSTSRLTSTSDATAGACEIGLRAARARASSRTK